MAGRAQVEVVGLNKLRRTMKAAGADLTELRDLNRSAAETVAPAARASAPIGPSDGGHIASTIRVTATPSAGVVKVGSGARGRFPYAGPLHYGWPARNIRAQPWLIDAASRTEGQWVNVYTEGVNRILAQVEGA